MEQISASCTVLTQSSRCSALSAAHRRITVHAWASHTHDQAVQTTARLKAFRRREFSMNMDGVRVRTTGSCRASQRKPQCPRE